jgi:uncharacterized protein (DUF1501 family)
MLTRQLEEVVGTPQLGHSTGLASESPLRVAAATLSWAPLDQVTATTVVGVLGQDDAPAFEQLVADIAAEFGLDTQIRLRVGSFSVRFRRRPY